MQSFRNGHGEGLSSATFSKKKRVLVLPTVTKNGMYIVLLKPDNFLIYTH